MYVYIDVNMSLLSKNKVRHQSQRGSMEILQELHFFRSFCLCLAWQEM